MKPIFETFIQEAEKTILGKNHELKLALCCFLAQGHLLIEDVPGVGKTTFAKTFAHLLDLSFTRIQFTSDLMPSDLLGIQIFDNQKNGFKLIEGPIFHQFILADELNRGSAKTQSALLEAMEEQQVTLDGETLELPRPFFVVATQNPRSQIGTNFLPESQLDRFLMKLKIGYPDRKNEKLILNDSKSFINQNLKNVFNSNDLNLFHEEVANIFVSEKLLNYILDLLENSRLNSKFQGLSPRAGKDIVKAAKAWAYIHNRQHVLPVDVQDILPFVISHRLSSVSTSLNSSETTLTQSLIEMTPIDHYV